MILKIYNDFTHHNMSQRIQFMSNISHGESIDLINFS